MRLRPALLVGYYATVLAVMGLIVSAGIAHRARHPSSDSPQDSPKRLESASEPLPASPAPEQPSLPPTPVASPTPLTTPDPPHVAPRPVSASRVRALAEPLGAPAMGTTLATHYTPRPYTCWDPGRATHVPQPGESDYDPRYTAAHLPCGTVIQVSGPAGTVELKVWDHGPWGDPARGLDLSPAAFKAVVGPLSVGVGSVRVAPG